MATATSSRVALGLIALALAPTGCAGNSKPGASASSGPQPQGEPGRTTSAAALVRGPTATPAGWRTVRIDNGAAMPYPPAWHLVAGDAGTATAVLRGPHHEFLGYLNLTPRQGEESLRNWTAFRVAHDAREGDRSVKTLAAGRRLRFRNGRGACVRDQYTTTTGARYIELACLVAGRRATSVIVGASPPKSWAQISPSIERAISAFTT